MKTLTIEQMETTSGAKLSSACKEALASLGIGMLGVVFTAASVATGIKGNIPRAGLPDRILKIILI